MNFPVTSHFVLSKITSGMNLVSLIKKKREKKDKKLVLKSFFSFTSGKVFESIV